MSEHVLLRGQRAALPACHRGGSPIEPAQPRNATQSRDHVIARVHRARLCTERRQARRPRACRPIARVFLLAAPPAASARAQAETGHHRLLVLFLSRRVRDLWRFLASAGEHGGGVSRPLAAPEARGVVVGCADEDMAEWMEGERPDVRVVRLRERRARTGLLGERLGGGRLRRG